MRLLRTCLWAIPGLLLSAFVLSKYVATLAPTVTADDAGELQVLAKALGIAHTTGYPLFLWVGHLFSLLPLGEVGRRVTFVAAASGAAATFMIYRNGAKLAADSGVGRWIGAAAAALAFGLGYTFWWTAILCEMYTFHVFLAMVVLALAMEWSRHQRDWQLAATGFAWGMMLGNHLSSVALAPALGMFALVHEPRQWLRPRRLALALGSVVAGGLIFNVFLFWLLWRQHLPYDQFHSVILAAPDLYHARDTFWYAWWYTVSGGQFQAAMSVEARWVLLQIHLLPHRIIGQYYPLGAAIAGLGWLRLWRRWWQVNLLLTLLFFTQTALNMHYQVWKVTLYYVTPYACVALWLAVALGAFAEFVIRCARQIPFFLGPLGRPLAAGAAVVAMAILCGCNLYTRDLYRAWIETQSKDYRDAIANCLGGRPDNRHDTEARDMSRRFLDHIPSDAVIFASWWILYPLQYVARFERRIDTITMYEAFPFPFGWSGGFSPSKVDIVNQNRGKHPVFLADDPRGLPSELKTTQVLPGLWKFE